MSTRTLPTMGRRGVSWAPVLFLLAFLVALAVIAIIYLEPMLRAAAGATPEERGRLSAFAMLALMIVVIALLAGLMLTLRIGRNIARMAARKPAPTRYPDAWEESARRLKTPEADELENN
jgi:hypothetical protein